MRTFFFLVIAALVLAIGTLQIGSAQAHPVSGAIFTTLPDGSVVNENVGYTDKCQVALNGGPQGQSSHHLPDGTYDVGVTDPSGKVELGKGLGAVVISNGIGTFGPTSLCDLVDDPSPYLTTPNNGGVYKAWLCVSGQLFVHHDCKTDNFKVKEVEKPPVVIEPTPTPPPTGLVPPAKATPTPEIPTQLPDSGGAPPSDNDARNITLVTTGVAGLILSLIGGFIAWRRSRFGVFEADR